ncbi:MAG TPA: asparagine synthase-related protein [Allosphingosinicella sp.]
MPLLTLPGHAGSLLGSLFNRRTHSPVEGISDDLADRISRTKGDVLLENYWGRYLLFLSLGPGRHLVLRDPSGSIPAYHSRSGEMHLYACDFDTSGMSALVDAEPDPGFVAQAVAFPFLRSARTGIAAVRELLPGERRTDSDGTAAIDQAWTPWAYANRDDAFQSFDAAAAALRAEVLSVVPRHAGSAGRTALELSGGLDSSIVAMSLSRGGADFCSVTFATSSPDGDERPYARQVAEAAEVPLDEIGAAEGPLDLSPRAAPSLRPGPSPALQPLHRAFARYGRDKGIDTFVTGAGGDNVFCFLTTAAPALDAWRALGIRQGIATLRDLSEICNCTLWTAARFAGRKLNRPPRPPYWPRELDFLGADAADIRCDGHPWLEAPRGTPVGKREHVRAILHVRHFLDAPNWESDAWFVHPLLAQPLLELCLRVPTWMWTREGRDRAVARSAFAPLLPPEILNRRSKGRLESVFLKAFAANRPHLLDLLSGGRLEAMGLLDRQSVELYLAAPGEPQDQRYFRIFELAAVELWLRSWRR